jgi:hypothetical protein
LFAASPNVAGGALQHDNRHTLQSSRVRSCTRRARVTSPETLRARLLLGYIYPAYACFKALERRKPDGVRVWCEYWCAPHAGATAAAAHQRRSPRLPFRLILAVFAVLESVGDQTVFWYAL